MNWNAYINFSDKLKSYSLKNKDASYTQANVFLNLMARKAEVNSSYAQNLESFVVGGSTLLLLDILEAVGYDNSSLSQFNAFSLLDTVSIK